MTALLLLLPPRRADAAVGRARIRARAIMVYLLLIYAFYCSVVGWYVYCPMLISYTIVSARLLVASLSRWHNRLKLTVPGVPIFTWELVPQNEAFLRSEVVSGMCPVSLSGSIRQSLTIISRSTINHGIITPAKLAVHPSLNHPCQINTTSLSIISICRPPLPQ